MEKTRHNDGDAGFRGLLVPMVTPMRSDLTVDQASTESLAKHLADAPGVAGIVTGARIGEGPVLSFEEHLEVTAAVRRAVGPDVPVVASLLASTPAEGHAQTEQLRSAGAEGVMVFPPLLLAWGSVPEEVRYAFWEDLDGGTHLPLVMFQIPLSNYWYRPETCARIAALPNVVSMKEASFDMRLYGATLEAVRASGASMTMLNGNDRFVAEGAIMGAEGALIGIANLMPSDWAEILRLAGEEAVSEALEHQRRMRPLQELIFCEPILDAVARMKVVLADMGVIEHAGVRRPQLGVSDAERRAVLDGYRRVEESINASAARA